MKSIIIKKALRIRNMKKILQHPVFRYAVLVILAILIGLNIFHFNASRLLGDALPMPFGFGMSTVLSGSMEPALSVGDLLIVKAHDSYQVGDIVVYQSGRTPVVHRIVEISDESVTTCGDANNTNDNPFHPKYIKGKVVMVIPWVGNILWAIKQPVFTILAVIAAVLLIELSFHKNKESKSDEQEKIKEEIRVLMEELNKK